jgi:hypothetical protein
MSPVTMRDSTPVETSNSENPDGGAGQLLRWGASTLGAGFFFAILTKTVFGGIGPQGPHTNGGWLSLIAAMGCLPFGSMLSLLGAAKWLRNKRQKR